VSGAVLAHLGYLQVEKTIVAYNQSAGSLAALERDYPARRGGAEPLTCTSWSPAERRS